MRQDSRCRQNMIGTILQLKGRVRKFQEGFEYLIIDTAGRLHTKSGLMDELEKIKRVIEKHTPISEVLLVIDASSVVTCIDIAAIKTLKKTAECEVRLSAHVSPRRRRAARRPHGVCQHYLRQQSRHHRRPHHRLLPDCGS